MRIVKSKGTLIVGDVIKEVEVLNEERDLNG